MTGRLLLLIGLLAFVTGGLSAQQAQSQKPPSQAGQDKQNSQERAQAERDVPKLVEVLDLKPGMTVADVGAGGGNMSVVLAKWIGAGRVFSTDIGAKQLQLIRDNVKKDNLTNVTVLEGTAASNNLPAVCCDAIFLRNVYHHITELEAFNKSLVSSLKPGGRLAILDNPPGLGSPLPEGVPSNRGGHGVPSAVVTDELVAAGVTHVRTIDGWPPGDACKTCYLVLFRKQ
jgi:SAM-dependent methyltransferase